MIYFYLSLLTYFFYSIIKYKNALILLKEKKYNTKEYLKEIKKRKYYINKETIIILLIIIAVNLDLKTIEITTILIYMLLSLQSLNNQKKLLLDNKIKTRIIILLITFIVLNIWFILDYKSYHPKKGIIFDNSPLYYIVLYLYTYISHYITLIINIISKPIDKILK